MSKRKTNFITEVHGHDISWHVDSKSINELDESSKEYIKQCIMDDISQGELNVSYGRWNNLNAYGWWRIINWRDIACELYHAVKSEDETRKLKATKRFDDEWTF